MTQFPRTRVFLIAIMTMASASVFAQSEISELIKSSPADATKLANAYLQPLFKGFGIGLNSGWNNTAHSKNLLRFELRLSVTGAVVPPQDESFDITKIGLSAHVKPTDPAKVITPTLAGSKKESAQLTVYDDANKPLETFSLPTGTGLTLIPTPQIQGTIGLSRGIDVTLRGMPKLKLGGDLGSVGMFGAGIKLEVLPLISGTLDRVFPLDLAVALGYNEFNYEVGLTVKKPSDADPASSDQSNDFSNQRMDAKFSGINTELIVSKKLLIFTPFLSVGYNSSKTDVGLKGNYPVVNGYTAQGRKTYTVYTDPVHINQTDISGFRTNLGFQLNLAFFRLYGSYSMAEYNSFNGGIGFGLGK